jgi:hypothetical protein
MTRFKTVEILMVGDSTVKRAVSYTQKKAASLETAFSKPTLARGPVPLIPAKSYLKVVNFGSATYLLWKGYAC